MRWAFTLFLVIAVNSLPGCKPAQPIVPDNLLPDPIANDEPLPTYSDLIRRYNQTVESLDRVWAAADVDMIWLDQNGKRKHESGGGKLIYVRPRMTVLEIEEFGKGFWAGSDTKRYWFFERQDNSAVYVGRFDRIDAPRAKDLPLPVNPRDIPYVLGFKRIDPDAVPEAPAVERLAGYYLIEPPGLSIRMLLDPESARPVRVDLLDEFGRSEVRCLLSGATSVKLKGVSRDNQPRIAKTVDVYVVGTEAKMTLKLSGATSDEEGRKIRDSHFDFEKLKKALKPDMTIDLDALDAAAPKE